MTEPGGAQLTNLAGGAGDQSLANERLRLELEARRLALDESWPKKWGAVMLGAAATVVAAIVTGGLGVLQHDSDQQRAIIEGRAQATIAAISAGNDLKQKQLENDRAAADMYFEYLSDKPDEPQLQEKLSLVSRVASDPKILTPFFTAKVDAGNKTGASPSDVLRGSPSLIGAQATYDFEDFVAYIQYARGDAKAQAAAAKLQGTIGGLGFNAPGLQGVAAKDIPNVNDIRIYKPEHLAMAQALAKQLADAGEGVYCIRQLQDAGSLPNGVVELWIGHADAPLAGAGCAKS